MNKRKIEPGEIWKLGDHVLGCGSSTDKKFVLKVMENVEGG